MKVERPMRYLCKTHGIVPGRDVFRVSETGLPLCLLCWQDSLAKAFGVAEIVEDDEILGERF